MPATVSVRLDDEMIKDIELCKTHDIHIGYSLEDLKKDLDRF